MFTYCKIKAHINQNNKVHILHHPRGGDKYKESNTLSRERGLMNSDAVNNNSLLTSFEFVGTNRLLVHCI